MYKLIATTTNDGTHDMVTRWDIVPDSQSGQAGSVELTLANVPTDFFVNFWDYYIEASNLLKLASPANNTRHHPITVTDYPYSAVRANTFNIFESL